MDRRNLRQLNRATLARQGLLERVSTDVAAMTAQVGGLQGQLPAPPVIGMWSRLEGFTRRSWCDAVQSGRIVRGPSLRGTLHVHDVNDYRAIRMTLQPMFDRLTRGMRRRLRAQDAAPALELGLQMLEQGATTVGQLKVMMAGRFPHSESQALMNVIRFGLPVLFTPSDNAPDGWKANAPFQLAREQLGEALDPAIDDERIVTRFLAALGPGSVKDAQTWSGITGLKLTMRQMLDDGRLELAISSEGHELFDLPGAARPESDVEAPPRFLPMWDNLLLSHADRSRVIDPKYQPFLASKNGMSPPTYLIDGFVHGTWRADRMGDEATLTLAPFTTIPARHREALIAEGESLLRFLDFDAVRHVVHIA